MGEKKEPQASGLKNLLPYYPLPIPLFSASRWSSLAALLSEEDFSLWCEKYQKKASFFSLKNPRAPSLLQACLQKLQERYREAIHQIQEDKEEALLLEKELPIGMTTYPQAFYLVEVGTEKVLIQWKEPAILIKPFFFQYSPSDRSFRGNVLGKDKIFWGLQFSFPYIYYDPIEKKTFQLEVKKQPNCLLFLEMRKWLRNQTRPTCFLGHPLCEFRWSNSFTKTSFFHRQLEKNKLTLQIV